MSWNLALQINKLTSITRVSGSDILIYNASGVKLASYKTTGLFLGDADAGASSAGVNKLVLPSYGSLTWGGITATPPSILTGGGVNMYYRAGAHYLQNTAGNSKGIMDFAPATYINTANTVYIDANGSPDLPYHINNNNTTPSYFLPDARITPIGNTYTFNNNSSVGSLLLYNNTGGTLLYNAPSGSIFQAVQLTNATQNGTWDIHAFLPSNVHWGSAGASIAANVSLTGPHDLSVSSTGKVNTNTVASLASGNLRLKTTDATYSTYLSSAGSFPTSTQAGLFLHTLSTGSWLYSYSNIGAGTAISLNQQALSYNWTCGSAGTTQAMGITSDGKLVLGFRNSTTSTFEFESNVAQPLLFINGTGLYIVNMGMDATGGVFRIGNQGGNGVLLIYNNNVWGSYSDARLKDNITPLVGLEKIMKLKPVSYSMKTNPSRTNFGFIAQDVLPIIPEIIDEVIYNQETGETRYAMSSTEILPFAVKAIQEQQDEIVSLKAQLASLKATVDALVASTGHLVI